MQPERWLPERCTTFDGVSSGDNVAAGATYVCASVVLRCVSARTISNMTHTGAIKRTSAVVLCDATPTPD